MTVEQVQQLVRGHWSVLTAMGVTSLAVFGSTARGEAGPESDVDFLVEFGRPIDLFDFIGVKLELEDLLSRRVDLVMPDALQPAVRERALQEAVRAA